jgi:hypothetical protein
VNVGSFASTDAASLDGWLDITRGINLSKALILQPAAQRADETFEV